MTSPSSNQSPENEVSYRLIEDNDGHWYVIPTTEADRFNDWLSTIEKGNAADARDWDYFDGQCRVDGPHAVEFTKWKSL